MKKLILAGAVAALLSACAGIGGMLGGGNSQVTALSAKSTELTVDIAISLDASAKSYVDVLDAVGNKTEAERIKAETANLRDEKDKEKLEAAMGMLNEVDITAQLESAEELSDEGKGKIAEAILYLGIAVFYDGKAGKDAKDLVTEAKDVLSNLSASDALAVGEVNNIITNATWVADMAPNLLSLQQKSFEGLKAYASAHGIEIPSMEEIEKKAESIGRE